KFKNAAVDILEVNGIRVPHWSAAMSGEAIAVDVDDVDVPGAQCVAFFEDARAFVYQGVEAAVHNFFAGNLPLRNFRFRRPFSYQSGYFRIGDGAPIFVVFVPPRSVFLAESPHFAKAVSREGLANAGFLKMSVLLANSPANIESREVSHGQRSHGQAEIVERAVDFLNGRSFFQQKYRLPHVRMEHAVAHEAATVADQHADLAELLGKLHTSGDDFLAGCFASNDFQQAHDVRGTEEMRPDDKRRPTGRGCNLVDIQGGRVAGENGTGLADLVELRKDLFLERHGNPAAHRAGANHAGGLDWNQRRVFRYVGDFCNLALGEENVHESLGLQRDEAVGEKLLFDLTTNLERHSCCGFHGVNGGER